MQEQAHSPARYHQAAIALHWVIAVLLVYQLALGARLDWTFGEHEKYVAFQLHKSVGITVLLLSIVRLGLRLTLARPAELGARPQRLLARLVHWGFYAVMLLGPLTGWVIVSTAKLKVPTLLFGWMPWPHLPLPKGLSEPAELAHLVLAWSLPLLIALHLAGVIYHLRARDAVPRRMLTAGVSARGGVSTGLALLTLVGALGWWGPLPDFWKARLAPAPSAAEPLPEISTSEASDPASEEPAPTATASDAAVAVSCDWTVAPGSRLGFTTAYGNTPIAGTFHKWQARIRFCEDDLPHASIAANVNLASADTADADRDENLKGASFFDTARFAQARFTAAGFKKLGPSRYAANGTLSLHGQSRPVKLVFNLKVDGDNATAQGSTSLSRLAFGVGSDEWSATDQVPDAVAVQFTIRARRAN